MKRLQASVPKRAPPAGRATWTTRGDPEKKWTLAVNPPAGSMSIVPAAAACDRRLGAAGALAVLIVLGKYRNSQTGECYPSLTTIATHLGITRRTVQRHIDTLVECGFLGVTPQMRVKGGGWASNRYMLYFRPLPDVQGSGPDGDDDSGQGAPTVPPSDRASSALKPSDGDATPGVATAPGKPASRGLLAPTDATPDDQRCDTARPTDATPGVALMAHHESSQSEATQSSASRRILNGGHEEDGRQAPRITSTSVRPGLPPARREDERPLKFPDETKWLHEAMQSRKPGAVSQRQIDGDLDNCLAQLKLKHADYARHVLTNLVQRVLEIPMPKIYPTDAIGMVVSVDTDGGDLPAALQEMREGMPYGAARTKFGTVVPF